MGNSASTSQLSPAGSSTYSSSILHVGDGTWDAARDDFLLPNIQGLNFATMRYNGMGNRFKELTAYHNLIIGHGIVAAITFLGVVPAAVLLARFHHSNPRRALRLHIGLQILTVILTTVVFVLGYFAVGPERSLTNPHHGIGTAIFVLVVVQALAGALIHKTEKGKARMHLPIRLMLHQWIGRAIALLAIAQIPIGLTLYGSPLYLFVLFALVVLTLLILYFVLTYQSYKPLPEGYHERGSYISGTQTGLTDASGKAAPKNHRGFGALAAVVTGGTGLAALRRRRSTGSHGQRSTMVDTKWGSQTDSASQTHEKYSNNGQDRGILSSWKKKITALTAGSAGAGVLKGSSRRKLQKGDSHRGNYQQPSGEENASDLSTMHALEEGRTTHNDAWQSVEEREAAQQAEMDKAMGQFSNRPRAHSRRISGSVSTYSSRKSGYDHGQSVKQTTSGGVGGYFKRRRDRKEKLRVEAERQREYENRRLFGQHADTVPSNDDLGKIDSRFNSHMQPGRQGEPVTNSMPSIEQRNNQPSGAATYQQGPPQASFPRALSNTTPAHDVFPPHESMPPPPPAHSSPLVGPRSNLQQRPIFQDVPAVLAPNQTYPNTAVYPDMRQGGYDTHDMTSVGDTNRPPVAVKVKVHNDGTHVTLRRLGEEEAVRERQARRREQGSPRRRRHSSMSELSDARGQRFRRSDALPATRIPSSARIPLSTAMRRDAYQPYPPVASPHSGTMGSSPGLTGTELSYYNTNRQRRRAERLLPGQVSRDGAPGDGAARGSPRAIGPRVTFT